MRAYSAVRLERVAGHVGKGPERLFLLSWLQGHQANRHRFDPSRDAQYALYTLQYD